MDISKFMIDKINIIGNWDKVIKIYKEPCYGQLFVSAKS